MSNQFCNLSNQTHPLYSACFIQIYVNFNLRKSYCVWVVLSCFWNTYYCKHFQILILFELIKRSTVLKWLLLFFLFEMFMNKNFERALFITLWYNCFLMWNSPDPNHHGALFLYHPNHHGRLFVWDGQRERWLHVITHTNGTFFLIDCYRVSVCLSVVY